MNQPCFVVRPAVRNLGWEVRFFNEELGESPVGPRLAKGTRYPNEIGTHFDFKEDAEIASRSWTDWYNKQPYLSKKLKAKYIA